MAGKVTWAGTPGVHAYSVDATVGPWDCKNELLDVMLVQYFLKSIFEEKGPRSPLGKTIELSGRYDATTHYWTMVFNFIYLPFHSKEECRKHKIQPLASLTPNFLNHDNSMDLMENLNRQFSKNRLSTFADLSVVASVPTALQKRLKTFGYTL